VVEFAKRMAHLLYGRCANGGCFLFYLGGALPHTPRENFLKEVLLDLSRTFE